VGFIRKLPPELVAAFRATLEELTEADVLVHVVDASHPSFEEHMAAVETLLDELEVGDRPVVLVLNKVDRIDNRHTVNRLLDARGGVAISAVTGEGLDSLRAAIAASLPPADTIRVRIPHGNPGALALCYNRGRVVERSEDGEHVTLEVSLPPALRATLAPYKVARVH
jgi:GTP-binding protein HflX